MDYEFDDNDKDSWNPNEVGSANGDADKGRELEDAQQQGLIASNVGMAPKDRKGRQKEKKQVLTELERGITGIVINAAERSAQHHAVGAAPRTDGSKSEIKFAGCLLDGSDCKECGLGESLFGDLFKLIPNSPALPPILAARKVEDIANLAWLSTLATSKWPAPKKIAALKTPVDEVQLSVEGLACAWYMGTISCSHMFDEEESLRQSVIAWLPAGKLAKIASSGALVSAWSMLPEIEKLFKEQNESATLKEDQKGTAILIPPEMNVPLDRTPWRTLIIGYKAIDYLADAVKRRRLDVDQIILVPPVRRPVAHQTIDLKSLVEAAEEGGAKNIIVIPPLYTVEGWCSWRRILKSAVGEEQRRLKYIESAVACQFDDWKEETPSVVSPYGCVGMDPMRGGTVLEKSSAELFFKMLAKHFPCLEPSRKRTHDHGSPEIKYKFKRSTESAFTMGHGSRARMNKVQRSRSAGKEDHEEKRSSGF